MFILLGTCPCSGFEPVVFRLPLNEANVEILIPNFIYRPSQFIIEEAVCILDKDQANLPIIAIVKGHKTYDRHHVISVANLSFDPLQVILSTIQYAQSLENTGVYCPGYTLPAHKKNLQLRLQKDQYNISFPKGEAI